MINADFTEENLTVFLEHIFDWIEASNEDSLYYDGINFRGALERYFYFGAINAPQNLLPLLKLAKPWRAQEADANLTAFYDQCLTNESLQSVFKKAVITLKITTKATIGIVKNIDVLCFKKTTKTHDPLIQPIGFFAINNRFVLFFKDVIEALKLEREGEKIIFFSNASDDINDAVIALGTEVGRQTPGLLHWKQINMSPLNPLFNIFITVINSYLSISSSLKKYYPSVLVFAEGTSMYDEIAAQSAKKLGIETIRMQSGRAGVLHSGYRRMSFDKMLCWGEAFVERYQQHSPAPEYVVTGSLLFNKTNQVDTNKQQAKKLTVFTQPISLHISESDYQQLVNVVTLVINQLPTIEILIRKHPVDHFTAFDHLAKLHPTRIFMANSHDVSLENVLNQSKAAIGFFSTTLSEAAAFGVIPIILKLKNQHSVFPFPEKYGAAIVVKNEQEALDVVDDIVHNPKIFDEVLLKMQNFANLFFGPRDGSALENIINIINQKDEN